jgi:hypothetical protein
MSRAVGFGTSESRVGLALLLLGLFLVRLYYGLSLELRTTDEIQVYLLGLKFFSSGQWPFFGPDVNPGQIAGPLQGLVVGVPLVLAGAPEAPLILLNVLSFAGLVLLGWYLTRRFRLVPAWIAYTWLLTCPWTLNFSTHVYNPSYLLFLGCLFFVGFFELMPSLTGNLVPSGACFFIMGFSMAASAQFHRSWPSWCHLSSRPSLPGLGRISSRFRSSAGSFLEQQDRSPCSCPQWPDTASRPSSRRSPAPAR